MIHLDTSFAIDLLRERRRGSDGPASALLRELADEALWVSVFVVAELAVGLELSDRPVQERRAVEGLLGALQVTYPDDRFPAVYGRLFADLQRRSETVPTMDLLIAAAARVDDAPLVTGNAKHFRAIPELRLRTYREAR